MGIWSRLKDAYARWTDSELWIKGQLEKLKAVLKGESKEIKTMQNLLTQMETEKDRKRRYSLFLLFEEQFKSYVARERVFEQMNTMLLKRLVSVELKDEEKAKQKMRIALEGGKA